MKNILTLLLISTFILSCSKKEDDPTTETPVLPLSPKELTIQQISNTQVLLKWKDNSSTETGFKIGRKMGNGDYTQVAMVGVDITNYIDTGLVTDTPYSYDIIAYNAVGNSPTYLNEVTITLYPAVTIGGLMWMPQNLDVDHYRNGDPIPQVTDPTEWANLTTGAWCYYKNQTANGPVYGKLYNFYAVNDPRGLAPYGWHVATKANWIAVTDYLGGEAVAGGAMKSTSHWTSPNTGATNSSGFSAVASGARTETGVFNYVGTWGVFWTADNDTEGISFYRILYNDNTKSEGYHIYNQFGMAVRCVRD